MPATANPPITHFNKTFLDDIDRAVAPDPGAPPDIKSKDELKDYLLKTFNARLPEKKVCSHHIAPWDAFCDAYFARFPVIVIKGSRGLAGKTWFLGLLAMAEGVMGADVAVLGGSGAQSKRVHKAMERFWNAPNSPRHLVRGEPGVTKTVFKRGNEIEALTASQNSVRGPHPSRLRLDEVDEMELSIFNAAMGQTLAQRGIAAQTVVASTHQHPRGTFSEVLKMAAERSWPVYSWCWRETLSPEGWLLPSEVERKRSEMTKEMWETEVELTEPSSEGLAINIDAVEQMFDRKLGESDGKAGENEEFEPPKKGADYATGADWGKSSHYSAIPTLRTDCSPQRFVAFYRDRRKPYHLMVPKLNERVKRYGGKACHDAHGVGAVIDELLTCEAQAYTHWQGAHRIALFSEYIAAIERGAIRAPRVQSWYAAHRYVTNNDLYGTGHPPDEFIGCALAYRASRAEGENSGTITDVTIWD